MKGKFIYGLKHGLNKNGSLLLAGASLVGFGVTVIFVARGQMKADAVIAERNQLYVSNPFNSDDVTVTEGEDVDHISDTEVVPKISMREYFDLTWHYYIPAAISGVVTVGCIIGSQYISRRQVAGLMASVAAVTVNRDRLEQIVREKYGDEAIDELKKKLTLTKTPSEDSHDILRNDLFIQVPAEETGYGDLLCYEGYFGRWFRSSEEEVRKALDMISEEFKNGMYVSYNDIYDELGIERSDIGYEFGWCHDDDYYYTERGIQFLIEKKFDEKRGEDVLAFYVKSSEFLPMQGFYEI